MRIAEIEGKLELNQELENRNEIIKENFGWIIGSIVVLGGTIVGLKIRAVYKKGGSILYED